MEIKNLQVLVMPNGEVLCEGKTVGFTSTLEKYLSPCSIEQGKIEIKPSVVDAGDQKHLVVEIMQDGKQEYIVDYCRSGLAVWGDGGKLLGTGEFKD